MIYVVVVVELYVFSKLKIKTTGSLELCFTSHNSLLLLLLFRDRERCQRFRGLVGRGL